MRFSTLLRLLITTLVSAVPAIAVAGPVMFGLGANNTPEVVSSGGTGSRWGIGSGWGTDSSETSSPTLLGAEFDVRDSLASELFTLNEGASHSFNFGSITLTEPNAGGGILTAETDHLDLTAFLYFNDPAGVGGVTNSGAAFAVTGSVSDAAGDLSIIFAPILVHFGAGGQFTIDLQDLIFTTRAQTRNIDATVTLLSASVLATPVAVPEPSSLALVGTGAFALAIGYSARRRRISFSHM